VAVTADGPKAVVPYHADTWYVFKVELWTAQPRWQMSVSDAKGSVVGHATNLPWADLALTNGVLFGFSFSAQNRGSLFVDDFRIQEVEPTEVKPWPRKLVTYPKESK
jgi:hypothetical protein